MVHTGVLRLRDSVGEWFDFLEHALRPESMLWAILFGVVALASFCYMLQAFINIKRRRWESTYYGMFCLCLFLWTASSALSMLVSPPMDSVLASLGQVGMWFGPAFMCLHVWRQVSYREITVPQFILYLTVPTVLTLAMLLETLGWPLEAAWSGYTWQMLLFAVYMALLVLRCYLLCFNVFYQMPRHMRRSTFCILIALTAVTLSAVGYLFLHAAVARLLVLAAMGLALYYFNKTFSIASSSNVIVTSRDFVFGNLSTLVLTVSRKGRILDWNKREPGALAPLPEPVYLEPVELYRRRIVQQHNGRVSAHDENVLTITVGGAERHYLLRTNQVSSKKRHYGYLVEISEVTQIYAVLRYVEEIAMIDQLTGMYNRNAYTNMADKMAAPENLPLAVVVGDVNNLKQLNDVAGHLYGDKLLVTVADIVKKTVPQNAFAARIGGDELVILLPQGDDDAVLRLIGQMEAACAAVEDVEIGVPSVSWGYALMQAMDEPYGEVFARADNMMYEKKRQLHASRAAAQAAIQENETAL